MHLVIQRHLYSTVSGSLRQLRGVQVPASLHRAASNQPRTMLTAATHRSAVSGDDDNVLVFSFGSNSTAQLRARVHAPELTSAAATLRG
jgi:hypothetical protein